MLHLSTPHLVCATAAAFPPPPPRTNPAAPYTCTAPHRTGFFLSQESFRELSDRDSTDPGLKSPVADDAVEGLPTLGAKDERAQQGTPASAPQSAAAGDGEATGREEDSGEVLGAAACGGGREQRGRFSLSESDLMDGDTTHGSEVSALDDDNTIHGSEISVLDAEENDEAKEGHLAGDGGCAGGRSPLRTAEAEGRDARKEGSGSGGAAVEAGRQQSGGGKTAGLVAAATGDGPEEASTASAASAAAAAAGSTVPSGATASAASASLGPGALARAEGWSDRDLLLGLTRPEDNPVLAAHDVSRSVGGVVVKRGLLLVCRNAVYFIDGFGTEPMLPKPGAPPPTAAEAAAAAAAAAATGRSADPLHGVRRLEEWELGGGAGGIGGGNDDGEVFGAKIKVTLRREGQGEAGAGAAGAKSAAVSTAALTAEQAGGGAGSGGGARGGEAVEDDEILALGRVGVQRFALDHIHAVYKRRYQLRDCGLEVFDVLGRSILVSFSTRAQQEEVLTYLLARGLPASIFSKGK